MPYGERYGLALTCSRDTAFKGSMPPPEVVNASQLETWKVPGPLMTSALALFGETSWLSTAVKYVSNHTYNATSHYNDDYYKNFSWPLFCRGMPFSTLWASDSMAFNDRSLGNSSANFVGWCADFDKYMFERTSEVEDRELLQITHGFLTAFSPGYSGELGSEHRSLNNPENLLSSAMFVANRAILTLLSPDVSRSKARELTGRLVYTSPGVIVQKPILSRTNLIILSVLIGLQLLGLSYLTYYLYRVPSWSDQLDAIAMARIGASLTDQGVLPALGPVSKEDLATLQTVGGLIGIVEISPRRESSITESVSPNLDATDGSEVELQRLTSIGEGGDSVGDSSISVKLELDAPGPILTTHSPRQTLHVPGLKSAWRAIFAWKKSSSVNEKAAGQGS
jgi:hypothetical protein